MAKRDFLRTAPSGAVERAMWKEGGKASVKPGGSPLEGMPKVTPDNPTYRTQAARKVPGGRSFESASSNQVISAEKRKKLKNNVGKQWGLKNAAARRLSSIGQSKFSGRAT